MYQRKSNILYKSVSEKVNVDERLVKDFIPFIFQNIRQNMESLSDDNFCVPGLGRFDTNKKNLRKQIEFIERRIKFAKKFETIKFYKEEIEKINLLLEKYTEYEKIMEETKKRKLQWHKQNGDPYGVYKKELEKNPGGLKELLDEE